MKNTDSAKANKSGQKLEKMVRDFLIINFTGKNDSIGLRVNNIFFVKKLQTNIRNNGLLVNSILFWVLKFLRISSEYSLFFALQLLLDSIESKINFLFEEAII